MIGTVEVAWLAGLLEGEGCFFNVVKGYAPRVALAMTDRDVVERASDLMGSPQVFVRRPQNSKHKDQYWCMLTGARAVGVMFTIYPFMGERRRAKIREVIARWKSKPLGRRRIGERNYACGHMGRPHYAHQLCHSCYECRRAKLSRAG